MVPGNREKRCLQEGAATGTVRHTSQASEHQCCRELELEHI